MTGRERLAASLAHRSTDRVAVDFGASFVTGIVIPIDGGFLAYSGV